ncbi:hypothetical protein TgHK011_001564 [Trichoderma gracile]|nr:hypothetical protein TgHK011_001564 [Trichoderma gracile]
MLNKDGVVLLKRVAYLWGSRRDPEFSTTYGLNKLQRVKARTFTTASCEILPFNMFMSAAMHRILQSLPLHPA